MPFQQFTDRARMVVMEARAEALESGHGYIDTEHILIGILREGTGMAGVLLGELGVSVEAVREKLAASPSHHTSSSRVDPASALATIGIDLAAVRSAIEASFGEGALPDPGSAPPFTPQAHGALEHAADAAAMLRHRYIGTEHLLLGLLRDSESLACKTLADLGVDLEELALATRRQAAPEQARAQQSMARFGRLARQLWELEPDAERTAAARHLRSTVMREALSDEERAVADAAVRFADRLDAASDQTEAAIRAIAAPPA